MTASFLDGSLTYLLDVEMYSNTYHILHGIDVHDENLGFDAITEVVLRDEHCKKSIILNI